ncbi:MAG: hypothetical protein GX620_05945 [Chloroflexi bacterium]|nr:hypothetical protein [Chloroflexota bacterium]
MRRILPLLSRPAVISGILALVLTGCLYGDALSLPLFSDDLVQIPWLQTISWPELWTGPSPYGYYRPLWYSLWRMMDLVPGGLSPFPLHALNLLAHFAAAWLIGILASEWIDVRVRGDRSSVPAAIATVMFAVFPFSRQAVVWPGAVYNPLVSAMATGAILAYDRARHARVGPHSRGVLWLMPAIILAALAPLMYEVGLLLPAAIVLVEVLGRHRARWPNRSWWYALPFAAIFLGGLVLWRAMRGVGVTGFGLVPMDLLHNAGFVLQGLIYPTAPLAQVVAEWLGFNPEVELWAIALFTLALAMWAGLHRSADAVLLGLGWIALFSMPPTVSMAADWFALAPRYLYMTAGGVALVWTAAITAWLVPLMDRISRPARAWLAPGSLSLAALVLVPAIIYIRGGMRLYRMVGDVIWASATAAQTDSRSGYEDSSDSPILLINLPMRITPHRRIYPLGFEGITPLPQRVAAADLVLVHTGLHDAAYSGAAGVVAGDPPSTYDVLYWGPVLGWEELADLTRQARMVYLVRYATDTIHLIEAGGPIEAGLPDVSLARYESPDGAQRIALASVDVACSAQGSVELELTWHTQTAVHNDVTVSVHLADSHGNTVAQADGYPLLGMRPFWLWLPGERLRDLRVIPHVPPGRYVLRVGMWEPATGIIWPSDLPASDAVVLPIECLGS